jgi:acyl-CoA dehydrogenase
MGEFSMALNDDQVQLRDWIHTFAKDVVRPAAEEWDEREEFPWPIVEEAAKIGLYGFDFMAQAMMGDPTGLTMPIAHRGAVLGRRRHRPVDHRLGPRRRRHRRQRHPRAGDGVGAPVLRHPGEGRSSGAFCVSEPDAGSDVSSLRTRAVYDEAKDEWVLNGTKAWITNGGIADIHVVVATVDPELRAVARPASSSRPTPRALSQGQKYKKHGIRPATPPRSCSTTCASPAPACSAARTSSTRSWPRPARR